MKPAAADQRFLQHRGKAIAFENYDHMAREVERDDLDVTPDHVLVLKNAGPKGGPGMPEWGQLPIPKKLLKAGVRDMLRISDARMSGTSYGACILHVAPESFVGGPLALVQTGDEIEIDVAARRIHLHVGDEELARRRAAWTAAAAALSARLRRDVSRSISARPTKAATSIFSKARAASRSRRSLLIACSKPSIPVVRLRCLSHERRRDGLPDDSWDGRMHVASARGDVRGIIACCRAHAQSPAFRVDPYWPKPLPNNWILGQVGGISVDAQDNIWVFQRPRSLTDDEKGAALNPPRSKCCVPAPSVLVFNQSGDLVKSWGGPGENLGYDWPLQEHGILVDNKGFVWLSGNGKGDSMVLKFTTDGKFVKQIRQARAADQQHGFEPVRPWSRRSNSTRRQRNLRRRRLWQPPRRGARRRQRRNQAHLGRLRQTADRRQPAAVQSRVRRSSPIRCIASRSPKTDWSMSATAPTTACRCFARTAASCGNSCSIRHTQGPGLRLGPGVFAARQEAEIFRPDRRHQQCARDGAPQRRRRRRQLSAGPAATPASFTGCTPASSIRAAIFIPARSIPESGCRNGCRRSNFAASIGRQQITARHSPKPMRG